MRAGGGDVRDDVVALSDREGHVDVGIREGRQVRLGASASSPRKSSVRNWLYVSRSRAFHAS